MWRNRICESSQRPSAKSTEKNVEHCRVMYRTFNNMGNVYGYNIGMQRHFDGKEFLNLCKVLSRILKVFTLKQMFDVTAQIVNNEEEIAGLDKILYQKNSWTRLSLIEDEVVINLQSTKVYVFSDSV